MLRTTLRILGVAVIVLALLSWAAWCTAALAIDAPGDLLPTLLSGGFAVAALVAVLVIPRAPRKALGVTFLCIVVTGWWLSIEPSNERDWKPDVAVTPFAEIEGDVVRLHGVRDCEYRTETDYTPHFGTRVVDASRISGVDVFLCYWGSEWIAHPFVSFQIEGQEPVCFSIEARYERGEGYSTLRGFFRQYELAYVVAEERDLVLVRTRHRAGEDVYLFRTRVTPERARALFLDYVATVNEMHANPRWYNALTTNCTTGIRMHAVATTEAPAPWDWRILLPGKADELLAMRGTLASDLPPAELKERGHVNAAANAAGRVDDFSRRIRRGVPGYAADGSRAPP